MYKLEAISAVIAATALVATPVIIWSAMMFHELEMTGAMIAAIS